MGTVFNPFTGNFCITGSSSASNSFTIWQPPNGTSPTAATSHDTMTLTSSDSSVTITGNSSTDTLDFKVTQTAEYDAGNSGTSLTLDFSHGPAQKVTLTGNCTFTFSNTNSGQAYVLKLVQDATGSRTVTWPATVKWSGGTAPTLTTTASKIDLINLYYDGTDYYGSSSLNY